MLVENIQERYALKKKKNEYAFYKNKIDIGTLWSNYDVF